MKKLIRWLGKKVQALLNKIFKETEQTDTAFGIDADVDWDKISEVAKEASVSLAEMTEAFGQIYINGEPFGDIQGVVSLSADEISDEKWEEIKKLFGDGGIGLGTLKFSSDMELPENFFNTPLTLLPKRYWCKTLLISLVAEQENDYQAVDLSQYEERKLVHYIIGRTQTWEELIKDMSQGDEEEYNWLMSQIDDMRRDGIFSSYDTNREIFYYEEFGLWSLEELFGDEEG